MDSGVLLSPSGEGFTSVSGVLGVYEPTIPVVQFEGMTVRIKGVSGLKGQEERKEVPETREYIVTSQTPVFICLLVFVHFLWKYTRR